MSATKREILIAEDHAPDANLIRKAFSAISTPVNLHLVINGVEAMSFLQKTGRYTYAPRPHLVLLDRHMPRKDGREVLIEMRSDPALKVIPVLMMANQNLTPDPSDLYALQANGFFFKPLDVEGFLEAAKAIETFWFRFAALPD